MTAITTHYPNENSPRKNNMFYPRYDGTMNEAIKPINKIGIKHF